MNETFTYPKLVFTISKAKIAFFEYQSQIREQISSPNLQVFIVKFFGFKKYIMQLFSADAIVSEKVKKLLIISPDPLFHSPTQTTAHSPELIFILSNLGTRHLFSYLWYQFICKYKIISGQNLKVPTIVQRQKRFLLNNLA